MAVEYNQHTWGYGEELTPDKLNNIEGGVKANADAINEVNNNLPLIITGTETVRDSHGYIPLGIEVTKYALLGIITNRSGWVVNIVQGASIWGIVLSDPSDNTLIPQNEEVKFSAYVMRVK